MDYTDLTLEELEELSETISTIIEEKKKYAFTDEYMNNLDTLLLELEEWIILNIRDVEEESVKIYHDRTKININFEAKKVACINLREKFGKWYLNHLIVCNNDGSKIIHTQLKPHGLVVYIDQLFQGNFPKEIYSTLDELKSGIKELINKNC